MSKEQLTPSQQAVIENSGGALLVSAAAGSGKTMVLVRRLLARLCDAYDPKNIDDFLIITYTKAAASELRSKIARGITEALSENPSNRHLARQLHRLNLAQISTVHSFCASILRSYAHELDIPADFKVAEERESLALRQKALEQTLEQVYAQIADDPAVRCFVETLGYGRDDREAGSIVLRLYDSMRTHADPDEWMRQSLSSVVPDEKTELLAWERELIVDAQKRLKRLSRFASGLAEQCMDYPPFDTAYAPALENDAEMLLSLSELSTWEAFRNAGKPAYQRVGTIKKDDAPEDFKAKLRAKRDRIKTQVAAVLSQFTMERSEAIREAKSTTLALSGAFTVVKRFRETYAYEKRRRHLLDYSDLESEALRLLVKKGTRLPTRIAGEISERYAEIMVDEYQDTNEIQDLIFSSVSKDGKNLFMVGDVKQSIYRFRLADPMIFLRKYRAYADYEKAADGEPRKILLSANFRSKPEILDAVNSVFSSVMSEQVGDLDYGEREQLRDGRDQPRSQTPLVELHCINADVKELRLDEQEDFVKAEIEAEWIASRIEELLASGEAEPKDITILLRSPKKEGHFYLGALERRAIPTVNTGGGSILQSVEIETLCSLLQILDNPHQDIPLIGAMTGPIFGFTYDEMSAIRAGCPRGDFYDAVCHASRHDAALKQFLEKLTALQTEQRLCRLSELLQLLERELGLRNIFAAMENGLLRVRNLNLFYQLAAGFETDEPKTLRQFLSYLSELDSEQIAPAAEQANAVQLLSIHSSKGLEYPIVFLAGLSKKFNAQDMAKPVLSHPDIGAACDVVNADAHIRYSTCAKTAIGRRLRKDLLSEELRVLYVAMTRPKNRLIMTYCSARLQSELQRLSMLAATLPLRQAAEEAAGIGDWVLLTAISRMEGACLSNYAEVEVEKTVSKIPWLIALHEHPTLPDTTLAHNLQARAASVELPAAEELRQTLSYVYPHTAATVLPEKLTATQLKGRAIDAESAENASAVLPVKHFRFPRPQFAEKSRPLTATERGTATHLAMQYIRYEECSSIDGIRAELERLLRERFLTEQQYAAVEPETLWTFFSSELGRRVRTAENVVREFKFSVFMDAGVLDPAAAGEQVMLQGVTDCCILEPDGFTVIDYKTDRVAPGEEARLAAYYRGQLEAYGTALSRVFGLPVKQRLLYFFATGQFMEVSHDL